MDFSNRNVQSQGVSPSGQGPTANNAGNKKRKADRGKWGRVGVVALVAAVVILLVAAIIVAAVGNKDNNESQYVDTSKLQAVFLNTGQVYFGNVKTMNSEFVVLTNIYYLQTSNAGGEQANANANVTLVKLGCELHEPYDRMVINQDQVTFWENLQDNGQVAKAVATFEKQNPNGQKCADQSSAASNDSGNNAQNANRNEDTTP